MIIDVHAHYYPREYLERVGRTELPPRATAALGVQSVSERIELLDATGIDAQVLSVSAAQPYLLEPSAAASAAALVNDLYCDLCREWPGRFYTFAALPLPHVDAALEELARTSTEESVVGITLGCSLPNAELDDPLLEPVFTELDRRGTVVFLHPVFRTDVDWLAKYALVGRIGAPLEDTHAALRLVMSGITDRYPAIKFIVPHLGGTIPFLLDRIVRRRSVEEPDILAGLRHLHYDTVSGTRSALQCACAAFGAERLLFGTDYPYSMDEEAFRHHLAYLDVLEEDVSQVAGTNAERLLRLGESTGGT